MQFSRAFVGALSLLFLVTGCAVIPDEARTGRASSAAEPCGAGLPDLCEPGDPCVEDADCVAGNICNAGICDIAPPPACGAAGVRLCDPGEACVADADCQVGNVCNAGICDDAPPPVCGAAGVRLCDPGEACGLDEDCTAGNICNAGICDAAPVLAMALTSPSLVDGGVFPDTHTCAGINRSPALTWTDGPPGTQSYAIVFEDLTVPNMHWILYNIPSSVRSVAAALPFGAQPGAPAPTGSRQSKVTFSPSTYGYLGPCPPAGDHTYVFTVYALASASVPGVAQADAPESIAAQIRANKVSPTAEATLYSTYTRP